jgi:uncharacterized protein
MILHFQWDSRKAASNIKKHGVSFDEACTIFADPLSVTISDPALSDAEDRYLDLGLSHRGRLVVVSYVERGDSIRIISARRASSLEKKQYESAP